MEKDCADNFPSFWYQIKTVQLLNEKNVVSESGTDSLHDAM